MNKGNVIYIYTHTHTHTHIHTTEIYSVRQKNEMPFTATWVDLETIILSEFRQRKTNIIWYHLYVEFFKMIQMNLFVKKK